MYVELFVLMPRLEHKHDCKHADINSLLPTTFVKVVGSLGFVGVSPPLSMPLLEIYSDTLHTYLKIWIEEIMQAYKNIKALNFHLYMFLMKRFLASLDIFWP